MWGLSTSEGCAHVRGRAPELNPAWEQSQDPLPAYRSFVPPLQISPGREAG